MIVLLRNEMEDNHADTECCAIKTPHVEFMGGHIEIVYPRNGDITHIDVLRNNAGGGCPDFRWGDTYDFCILYDDDCEYLIREEFPKCKWFEE
jgi:hypothetical protein